MRKGANEEDTNLENEIVTRGKTLYILRSNDRILVSTPRESRHDDRFKVYQFSEGLEMTSGSELLVDTLKCPV